MDELPIMSDDISGATKTDPELDKVYDSVAGGWPGFVPDEQMKPYFRCRAKSKCLIGCGGHNMCACYMRTISSYI